MRKTISVKVSEEELEAWSLMAGEMPVTTWMRERLNAISSARPTGSPQEPAPLPAPEKIVAPRASQEVPAGPIVLRKPRPRYPELPPPDKEQVALTPERRPPSRFEGLVPTKAELEAETERIRQQNRDARISKGSQ